MQTFGETIYSSFEEAIEKIYSLSYSEYDLDSIISILSSLGTKFELYLKNAIFYTTSSRTNLVVLINQLTNYGISADKIDILHQFRIEYNNAKHERTYNPNLLSVFNLLKETQKVINEIVGLKLGISNNSVNSRLTRVFWIAGWDHYIGGDTEVHIILPNEFDGWLGPPTIDIIYIDISKWKEVKSELSNVSILKEGNEVISINQMKAFEQDSDFTGAFAFEGNYKDLISIMAKYELRQDLIENRHNDLRAMMQAFSLASLDSIKEKTISKKGELKEKIKHTAILSYAVPDIFKHFDDFTESFSDLFIKIPIDDWDKISGPSFCSKEIFDSLKEQALSIHSKYNILIDEDYIFRILH